MLIEEQSANLEELTAALQSELAPQGVLEQVLANEVRHAVWCLGRCDSVRPEPADGVRTEARRLLRQSMADLRRLQTDRKFAEFLHASSDLTGIGLIDWRAVAKAHGDRARMEARRKEPAATQKPADMPETVPMGDDAAPFTERTQSPGPVEPIFTRRTQSQPAATARNAKCPCGSGQKYKRCCGKDAPVLSQAA